MPEERERAERMAIISECMDSGVLKLWPWPWDSKDVPESGEIDDDLGLRFEFDLTRCFSSAMAGPSRADAATLPVFKAPPSNPGRYELNPWPMTLPPRTMIEPWRYRRGDSSAWARQRER